MTEFVKKYATAATVALFLAVAASGLAMFFHVGKSIVSEMHQWLAVTLVIAAGLHIYKNWGGLKTYFRRRTILAPLALTVLAAAAFIVPASLSSRQDPMPSLLNALQKAKLADVGRVLGVSPDELQTELTTKGFVIKSADQRLFEIASASQRPPMAVVMTVLGASRR
jgi:Domain of unknown function (DUF4405)